MKLRIKPSIVIAAFLAAGATAWILSGQVDGQTPPAEAATDAAVEPEAAEAAPVREPIGVRVIDSAAQVHRAMLRITGRTAADRRVTIRAEAEGRVTELGVEETRFLPVVNRAPRSPSAMAEITAAVPQLLETVGVGRCERRDKYERHGDQVAGDPPLESHLTTASGTTLPMRNSSLREL